MTSRTRRIVAGLAGLLVVLLVVGALVAARACSPRLSHRAAGATPTPTSPPPLSGPSAAGNWIPVPPVTEVPEQTPVQQQYDQALAQGLAASSTVQTAEVAQVPAPATSAAWPGLPVSDQPELWVRAFVHGLLDIDFARQPRSGLGAWLSAQEAPELLPGVPVAVQHKVLYLSLFDTAAVGAGPSPVPSTTEWQAYASAGAVWSVSDLLVQPDARWSQIIADGWQPVDARFGVDDVSGVLTVGQGSSAATHRFSLTVYVGSAHWHDSYGTVLVSNWKED